MRYLLIKKVDSYLNFLLFVDGGSYVIINLYYIVFFINCCRLPSPMIPSGHRSNSTFSRNFRIPRSAAAVTIFNFQCTLHCDFIVQYKTPINFVLTICQTPY